MAETVNLPRDSTLRELVAVQKASIIASGNAAAIVEHLLEGGRDDAQ